MTSLEKSPNLWYYNVENNKRNSKKTISFFKKNAIIIAMSGTGVPEEKGRKLDGRQKQ